MKCLWCDNPVSEGLNIWEMFVKEDLLCGNCRKKLVKNRKKFKIGKYKVVGLYLYEDNFSKLLLQYKECCDEALSKVFLYGWLTWFRIKYFNYAIVLMPSSEEKLLERGFNHLELIFQDTNLPIIDCLYKKENIKQMSQRVGERDKIIDLIGLKDIKIPKRIVLVDDVCTTGNTLRGALKLLDNGKRKIKIFTIATNIRNVSKV